MDSTYWPYILIVVLICFSAFFSGSEIAYASANKMRLKRAAEQGGVQEKTAYYIYENFKRALSTILIGNNLVNIAAASVATVIAVSLVGDAGAAIATAVMTVVILTFGEIIPKIIAKRNCDRYTVIVSLPLRFLMFITKPIVIVVMAFVNLVSKLWEKNEKSPTVTEEELFSIIETIEDEGVIDEDESELIQSALEFSEISAQEILTPRVDVLAIDIDDDIDHIIEIAMESSHSRIPVYENTIDNIIGILSLNKLFKSAVKTRDIDIRELLTTPCFIHKTMKLPAVLAELKRHKVHLAIVTDEYGGTMGIVTMEDALEQLVGEIWDETDEIINDFVSIGDNKYEVNGNLSIFDFFEYVDIDDRNFDSEYTTVGGWAIEMLCGFPNEGDSFDYENLTITIADIEELRINKLIVEIHPKDNIEEY